ncbi:MAG: hypothetical protein Q4C98_11540, partial [Capnocytophaga sp.]|nr:hypothetical protein [Capnocytophaga sp.]
MKLYTLIFGLFLAQASFAQVTSPTDSLITTTPAKTEAELKAQKEMLKAEEKSQKAEQNALKAEEKAKKEA